MAKLINGDGNKAIWAQQDADLIASLAGNVTAIADVGSKFAATQEDANTIGLADGVIVTKEGRRIQLDVGNVDLFDIPTGTTGVTSYYIIGYHLYTESNSSQVCETFVQKMDNATDVITENTFRGGATEVYVSCYRVTQTGMNITSIDALLQNFKSLSEVMSALPNKISVTSDGVKTYAELLNSLYASFNISKFTYYASMNIEGRGVFGVTATGANELYLSRSTGDDTSPYLYIQQIHFSANESTYKSYTSSGARDYTSSVVPNGRVIELYYC